MAEFYRSQTMEYVSITTTTEAARMTIKELGELAIIHVVDLSDAEIINKQHQQHKKAVVECGTWERKLLTFQQQMLKYNVTVPPAEEARDMPGVVDVLTGVSDYLQPIEDSYMANVNFMKENKESICSNEEWIVTLEKCKNARFVEAGGYQDNGYVPELRKDAPVFEEKKHNDLGASLLDETAASEITLAMGSEPLESASFRTYISGTIPLSSKALFNRALYRMSRGNAIVTFFDIENGVSSPVGDERVDKAVFNVMIIGKQLERRVRRMCSSYDAVVYKCPESGPEFDQWIAVKLNENSDKRVVLEKSERQVIRILQDLAWADEYNHSPLRDWQLSLRQEKGINATLMKAHFTQNLICIEGWIPAKQVPRVRSAISRAFQGSSHPAPAFEANPQNPLASIKAPPTYFETGNITGSFQAIVDTYGVPRYQEANPGLFTIVTFPFLFGVMYGDVGHGIFLTLAALYLVSQEKTLGPKARRGELNELLALPFAGRYMMVLMGIFAIYNGFIYNDCMAMPIYTYESMWDPDKIVNGSMTRVLEADGSPRVYPFGSDPNWYDTSNELEYFNSMKMKMSVILGVTQMSFGILLGGTNHVFFKDYLSLWFEWVPQVIFLSFTFGYMCFLIVLKWCTDWTLIACVTPNMPPSILQTMLKFFLAPGTVEPGMELYEGQAGIQLALLLFAFGSVPIMLLVKPLVLRHRMNNSHHALINNQQDAYMGGGGIQDDDAFEAVHADDKGEEHSFGDIMVHQIIHTIEFVLGAVSNTASYLRLWALSLAHSQLAKVFWNKVFLQLGLQKSGFMTVIAFAAWFGATFFVLLCMDSLECFLHALRLHWVEFQNKFYSADGYPFIPFDFEEKIEN